MEYQGRRLVMAVAQAPFEALGADGLTRNTFCTLLPLVNEDGQIVDEDDFPNCGLIWWLVLSHARAHAEPGRLVVGRLERAVKYDDREPDSMFFQVEPASVDSARSKDLVEIVDLPTLALREIDDLVNKTNVATLDHPPTYVAMVRWKEDLYGPFKTSSHRDDVAGEPWRVSFTPEAPDGDILKIAEADVREIVGDALLSVSAEITRANQNPRFPKHDDIELLNCGYEVIVAEGFQELIRGDHPRLRVQTNAQRVQALAKRLFTRKEQRQLNTVLRQLGERALEERVEEADARLVERIADTLIRDLDQAAEVADKLVESGILDRQLEEARDRRVEEYLRERSTELESKIQTEIEEQRRELEALQQLRDSLAEELDAARQAQLARLEEELAARRDEAEQRLREARSDLERERATIEQQRDVVRGQLEEVVSRMTDRRDELLAELVTILPLLPELGLSAGGGHETRPGNPGHSARLDGETASQDPGEGRLHGTGGGAGRHSMGATGREALELPDFVTSKTDQAEPQPAEAEFFDRFCAIVEARGFKYRLHDLQSFHLSVKTNDLTVLGGVSGTGKSSLPALYGEALAGQRASERKRYLHVGVSPGWLDPRDLLGHVNALTGDFQPAESGLYERMIWAAHEYTGKGGRSGLYVVCLDEMNLAHVEHYFSGFLQALPRPAGQRRVRCFDTGSVSPTSAFSRWAELDIPPTVRFVGTVNFDETTRQLSQRLLDRTDLIVLRPPELGAIPLATPPGAEQEHGVEGPPLTQQTVRSWIREAPLAPRWAGVVDRLRPHLHALGCPLTPRRYRAICRFVASAAAICPEEVAFDMQVAQRLLPQVRGLYGRAARAALEALQQVLEEEELTESSITLAEIREREVDLGLDEGLPQ